jgi:hypothetical protein
VGRRHLGPEVDVQVVPDKGLVYGVGLYDGYPRYTGAWLEHRPCGLVVMLANAGNRDFRRPNVIRYVGSRPSYRHSATVMCQRRGGWSPSQSRHSTSYSPASRASKTNEVRARELQ